MKRKKWKEKMKRIAALLLVGAILTTTVAAPAFAVNSYYYPDALTGEQLDIKEWTWSAAGEKDATDHKLTPTGLSQQQTGIMGGSTTKFWFQNEKSRSTTVTVDGKTIEIDFSKFNHRYYSCADSHNSGWFAPNGSQMVFKKLYFPTKNQEDYPLFIKNLGADIDQMKFTLLLISMLSSAYDTPSTDELKDSDKTSIYYYLLWLSIWANDIYAEHGQFRGVSPEADWDYVQRMVLNGNADTLNPDVWGSTAIYDAFRNGGAAEKYFFNCWKAAKFMSSLDFTTDIGTSLPVIAPALGEDGMYHMTFDYSGLSDYEKEVYRRLEADIKQGDWEYTNDGSVIDFKSADGKSDGTAIAVMTLQENSEEDRFYNNGFGMGGLAGFQGCANGKDNGRAWGNTQIYFSAVSEPLEILVGGIGGKGEGDFEIEVDRYEHEETWTSTYNIQLRKYDSETGQPLAGSKWDVLEAFDASQLDGTDLESSDNWANRNGSQFIRWDGWDYGGGNPDGDSSSDPCPWDVNVTNDDGLLMLGDNNENASNENAHVDKKYYTYNKGYCGGHPDPVIEESGDPEIDLELEEAAQAAWQEQVDICEALAAEGGFFHSINEGEARDEMEDDRDSYYKQFIALKYTYSAVELEPRPGYTIHGSHTDDIPIEIKTVTASEYKDRGAARNVLAAQTSKMASTPSDASRTRTVKVQEEKSQGTTQYASARKDDPKQDAAGEDLEDEGETASPSDATPSDASQSNADKKTLLEKLRELFEDPRSLVNRNYAIRTLAADPDGGDDADPDTGSVEFKESEVDPITQGRNDIVDHTFIVYDHRTEGEIHINKRDVDLQKQENDAYSAYGDTQGDGTLEGAVYGLFATKDIIHPDGKSGTVYQKDDLVAVAATDRNGDASFMAVTEAPGMTYNYETGQIEKRPGGHAPENLHRRKAAADAVQDMENYIGHDSNGGTVTLVDSVAGDGNEYKKLSSNQAGIEGLEGTHETYPIRNNEAVNGNCWIGRPLIVEENGTSYYVKELTRSEGYELSVNGKTNAITNGKDNFDQAYESADVTIGKITMDDTRNANYFEVKAENVTHDITLKGMDFPEGAAFELSTVEEVPDKILVPVYTTVQKPVAAKAGSYVYRDGKRVEAAVGDTVTFPGSQSYTVQAVSAREDKTIGLKPLNYHTMGTPAVTDLHSGGQAAAFKNLYNGELEKQGYKVPGTDAPWVRVSLAGTTDTEWITSITAAIKKYDLQYFNSLRITDLVQEGGNVYVIMRYEWNLYGDSRDNSVYVPDKDKLYVKKDTGNGYFVYAAYDNLAANPAVLSASMADGFLTRAALKDQNVSGVTTVYPSALPDAYTLVTEQTPAYWVYATGDQQINDDGSLKFSEEIKVDYEEKDGKKLVEKTIKLASVYDAGTRTYTVTLPEDAFQAADTVSLKVSDNGSNQYSYKQAHINGSYFAYLPLDRADDSYIINVLLTKPAADVPAQDGGTATEAAAILERPIKQKVKIVKDISIDDDKRYVNNTFAGTGHEDGYTQSAGGKENNAGYLPNFRFKIYQKSNLERLYRAEDGTVVWQDRNGNPVDIRDYRTAFPEKAQKLYTQVPHETDPLTRDTNRAAIANTELYSYTGDLINTDQNPGYTSILETTVMPVDDVGTAGTAKTERYNYEKFFDAINVANSDKWDRADNGSTSFKPFSFIKAFLFGTAGGQTAYPAVHNNGDTKNGANTSATAGDNATRSDNVRQFAITWYLDDEVKKLVKQNLAGETQSAAGGESYQEEIYDTALAQAIQKAENYLKPFFTYDFDEIYSIEWDSEADGGKDRDKTTLSADFEDTGAGYCYGVSEYLPYGTYVAVEQQPFDKGLNDFYNKHYKTDAPKEISLPAV